MRKLIIAVLLLGATCSGWAYASNQAAAASSNCDAPIVSSVTGNGALQGSCDPGCELIDLTVLAMMAADWLTCIDPTDTNCQHPWEQ